LGARQHGLEAMTAALDMAAVSDSPAANRAPAKIAVRNLDIAFPKGRSMVSVLSDVNLEILAGEFVCLLGPSGCGKSTLLNVLAGFLKPSAGAVSIDGQIVKGPDKRRIFVFQERGLFPWLTVGENIGFGLADLPEAERRERVSRYVELVNLTGFEQAYPRELSGGMKQRVEVARALAVNPDVLYMDEPFGALDSITRMFLREELLRIWHAERQTIVFVTHDVDEALELADRIVILSTRPAAVRRVLTVDLARPRSAEAYAFLRRELLSDIAGSSGR
jgi:ABC-type nitrate/sulfonate/bicarbonate transport system ATPase subunit